jgi:hypothetical protein
MVALIFTAHHAGSSPFAGIVSLLIFFGILRLAVIDVTDLEVLIGASVRECLRRADITEEQAADLMQMDLSALRRCLRGEGRLQLGIARLMRLGLTFMSYLTPMLLYHAARLHCERVREDAIEAAKALLGKRT